MAKLEGLVATCAQRNVELAVFPEAFLGGYPKGMDFGASLGIRTPEGRKLFQAYASCAISVPGPETRALSRIAKRFSLYLVIGVIEKEGGSLYCTVIYFAADGSLLGKHRKLMPTALERIIWGMGDGSTLPVFDSPAGKFGALICWENYMPLPRMAMYEQHIQLYCVPTVDDREAWVPTLRHIAREGRCFVLASCQYLSQSAYPKKWLANARNLPAVPIRGGSCIIDPMGEIMVGPHYGEETILVAKVDLDQIIEAKFDFDVVGHYARPDVFQFHVNTAPVDRSKIAIPQLKRSMSLKTRPALRNE